MILFSKSSPAFAQIECGWSCDSPGVWSCKAGGEWNGFLYCDTGELGPCHMYCVGGGTFGSHDCGGIPVDVSCPTNTVQRDGCCLGSPPPTSTPVPPTLTPTSPPIPPTSTPVPVPPTSTPVPTSAPPPIRTNWNCLIEGDVATIQCIGVVMQNIINFLIPLSGAVAVIFLIWAGIKYITAGGDKEKIESAKHTIIYALIGLLLVAFSFAIIKLIANLTGVSQLVGY